MTTNKITKQAKIAEQFQKHFEHYGFKKTSVDDIAAELKMSKKTIYQYFNSKEKVYYYIVSKVAQQFCNKMAKQLSAVYTSEKKLKILIELIFKESRKWLKSNDAFEFKYKYEIAELAFQEAYSQLIKQIMEEGMNHKEFAKQPLDLTVKFIQGLIAESMKLLHANPLLKVEQPLQQAVLKLVK
ncbi:MAG: TetR/AcrR family transcriptional regulator [Patescibacteria group bacterium]|jgi:AcrR family transcriptional regulator